MTHSLPIGVAIGLFLCGTVCADTTTAPASDVQVGNTTTQVVAVLGMPKGMLAGGNKLTYYYDRGTVEFIHGRLVKANVVSEQAAERIRQDHAQAEAVRQQEAARQQQRLTDEGRAALRKQLDDKQFAKRASAERLAFWQDFSKRYPYTDVGDLITKAAAEVAAQRRPAANQQEINNLKTRVAEIKQRLTQLDADYAASLAHWKRNEIDAERAKLTPELDEKQKRISELESTSSP